ncbi:MAG: response regulator [Chloroflexota bacterium]
MFKLKLRPQGGHLKISLSATTITKLQPLPHPDMFPGPWLIITIADSGAGIHPDNLPHIYEPFFTTKDIGQGTGLGLAQVYGIIKQHNGFIHVESRLNQGTTFILYLPVTLEQEALLPKAEDDVPKGNNQVILLVEDDPAVLEVTKSMLTYLGYRVICATNGEEALTICQNQHQNIDVLITDITMPKMSGLVLAQTLTEGNTAIKIIVTSGYMLEADDETLLKNGITCQLPKPVEIETLAQTLDHVLNNIPTP